VYYGEASAHSGSELATGGNRTGGPFAVAYSYGAAGVSGAYLGGYFGDGAAHL